MADQNRIYDGFAVLNGGMDGGEDASLIDPNQVALSVNYTFNGGLASVRNPFKTTLLTFADKATSLNWTGLFQGACFYQSAESGQSGFIVSLNGRLFRIVLGLTNMVTDITANVQVVTTGNFVVPAVNGTVNVNFNTDQLVSGSTVYIDGGQYEIQVVVSETYTLKYIGGSVPTTTINAGTSVTDSLSNPIAVIESNPASLDFVDLFQAENYVVVLAGQNKTQFFNGSTTRLASNDEIPPGVIGGYAWGRIWACLNDRKSFIAGDLVGSQSGTPQLKYVDAVLKVTENNYLNGGGSFTVPSTSGLITSIGALPMLDTSLGIGPVLVGTTNSIISINAPADRTQWQNLTYPIQTISALDYGPQAPRGFVAANSDMWYRSTDGYRSFLAARLDFNSWRNSPNSNEISGILDNDSKALLFYGSQMVFDNKMYGTVSPYRTNSGVAHRGLAVLNFDPASKLNKKSLPIYDGVYTGLQILQLVKGVVDGEERGFAFVLNDTEIELWELVPKGKYDEYSVVVNKKTIIERTPVQTQLETRRCGFTAPEQLKAIYTAELYLDNIVDNVSLTIKWRPDEYPTWQTWETLNFCVTNSQCTLVPTPVGGACQIWTEFSPQYAARVMLPTPPEISNAIMGGYLHEGYEFQFRLEGTGNFRIRKFKIHAKARSDRMEGEAATTPTCTALPFCNPDLFDYDSHGGVIVPNAPYTVIGGQFVPQNTATVEKLWDSVLEQWVYVRSVGGQLQVTDT